VSASEQAIASPIGDPRLKDWTPGSLTSMYPYVAPHTSKIHTLITLGISIRTKPLVFKVRNCLPRGFDSHRPLHSSLPCVSLRCPRTRLSLSPSSRSLDAATSIECIDRPLGRVRSRRFTRPHRPVAARGERHLVGILTPLSDNLPHETAPQSPAQLRPTPQMAVFIVHVRRGAFR
jgi:hypothetical protein